MNARALRGQAPPRKLRVVKRIALCLLALLAAAGCGSGSGSPDGGTGGSGGSAIERHSAYDLRCPVDMLVLDLPIELSYRLDRPYVAGGSSELTFSAAITFTNESTAALVDAGIDKIDIISLHITSSVDGAAPQTVETSSSAAPINDFDLQVDTDDDGRPGPHRLELDAATTTSTPDEGAERVELGLTSTSQISLVLGDFEVPTACLSPTLVGFASQFPVEPAP
ncbi:MAG: hypothetical protein WAU39_12105 [Polyangiales bacterium]